MLVASPAPPPPRLPVDEANDPTMFPESGGVLVANPGLADALFEMWRPEVAADAQ